MSVPMTSTVPAVLDRLKELLDARKGLGGNGLTGVTILTAPSGDAEPKESIQFYGTDADSHEWESMGAKSRQESYTLTGEILIVQGGAGEEVAVAARNRAYAIASEMQIVAWQNHTLRPSIGARTDIEYSTGTLEQGWQDNGRVAFVRFSVAVTSLLTW